jgi:hypothetical protein
MIIEIMPSFLPGVQECDAREAGLCTIADLIKNKNTLHLVFQIEKKRSLVSLFEPHKEHK